MTCIFRENHKLTIMKSNLSLLFALLVAMPISLFAQSQGDVYRQYQGAKVTVNGKELALPWVGGANRPQIAMADLNRDGRQDIVLYEDYIGVKTLIATGLNTYVYDSRYERNFPNVYGYIKLIDFNRDDVPDLVHRSFAGMGVHYGQYVNNELHFKYYKDVYYTNPTGPVNVHVAPGSIPGMADMDGDGDIDILAYNVNGTLIDYYRNCQVEDNLPADSIKICLLDKCFGKTYQNFEREQLLGVGCEQYGVTCKGCGLNKGTHGSNTLLMIDMDNDGDMDYFNGNESFSDIQFFTNGKAQYGVDSAIAQDTVWGANGKKMFMPIYPGAYHLNVNHEGGDDLLFTPMTFGTENYNSICLYENTGTNANKNFVFKTNTYLIDRMIDLGAGSYPVLFDYDKDGKEDLLVGSDGFYDHVSGRNKARVALYRNTSNGTKGNFGFELVTADFLGLSSENYEGTSLAVGDLDNDGISDLVIGHSDGTFTFFQNQATSDTVQPNWVKTINVLPDVTTLQNLDVGDFATPCIYDIDGDGKNDLISGNQYGDLYYFQNISGGSGSVSLKKVTSNLGDILLDHPNHSYGYTAPYIGKVDNTGKDYLVVGCQWGWLYRYDGFQNGANPATYTMIDSNYSYINTGARSTPAFANLDKDVDGLHELILGTEMGGLNFYKQDFKAGVEKIVRIDESVEVYPNPAKDMVNINWGKDFAQGTVAVRLVSVTGQTIISSTYDGTQQTGVSLQIGDLPSGMYYCVVQSGTNKSVQPVSVLK